MVRGAKPPVLQILAGLTVEKRIAHFDHASVAQSVEQLTLNQLVLGSNPSRGTFYDPSEEIQFLELV